MKIQIPIIFLEVRPLASNTVNLWLFSLFKTLIKSFFRDAVQTLCHGFLCICYHVKMMSIKVLRDFWEHKEITKGQVRTVRRLKKNGFVCWVRYSLTNKVVWALMSGVSPGWGSSCWRSAVRLWWPFSWLISILPLRKPHLLFILVEETPCELLFHDDIHTQSVFYRCEGSND